MNIPKAIKIGGYEIKVEFAKHLMSKNEEFGNYEPVTQTINIDIDNTPQQKEQTFLHELLEAIKAIYWLEIEHKDLNLLATVLHQIIKDNPEIFTNSNE